MRFRDRVDAGQQLAERLQQQGIGDEDVVVLGLPSGGVPVAFEVARTFRAPFDVIVVRKLGVPFQSELAMGAIGEGGVRILNREVLRLAMVQEADLALVERRERIELERRVRQFRGDRPQVVLQDRTVVVVDDGMATGSTALAACQVARALGARRVVMAVPVGSRSAMVALSEVCDQVVCLETPDPFDAVGAWYRDFSPTADNEVVALLQHAARGITTAPAMPSIGDDPRVGDEEVEVPVHEVLPGLVVFGHGSHSSRHLRSPTSGRRA